MHWTSTENEPKIQISYYLTLTSMSLSFEDCWNQNDPKKCLAHVKEESLVKEKEKGIPGV